jgi:hypothetical protein
MIDILGFVTPIVTNSHVLSAAAGAFAMWAHNRFSTFMGWYAANEAKISKTVNVPLPPTLPTTVAEANAAAAAAAPKLAAAGTGLVADVESALMRWKGDIVAGAKKI